MPNTVINTRFFVQMYTINHWIDVGGYDTYEAAEEALVRFIEAEDGWSSVYKIEKRTQGRRDG